MKNETKKKLMIKEQIDQNNKQKYLSVINSLNTYCNHCQQSIGREIKNIDVNEEYLAKRWQFKFWIFILLFILLPVVGGLFYWLAYLISGKKEIIKEKIVKHEVDVCPICKSTLSKL